MTRLIAYFALIACIVSVPKQRPIERIAATKQGISIELQTCAYDYLPKDMANEVLQPFTDSECIDALLRGNPSLTYEQADSILFTITPINTIK